MSTIVTITKAIWLKVVEMTSALYAFFFKPHLLNSGRARTRCWIGALYGIVGISAPLWAITWVSQLSSPQAALVFIPFLVGSWLLRFRPPGVRQFICEVTNGQMVREEYCLGFTVVSTIRHQLNTLIELSLSGLVLALFFNSYSPLDPSVSELATVGFTTMMSLAPIYLTLSLMIFVLRAALALARRSSAEA